MGSLTKKVKSIRSNKRTKMGKERKRVTRNGTTPRFPVHLESAPDCVVPMPPQSDPKENLA
ncbi:MAG: hypothetical protein JXX29_05680 [Deltaproteobacteria bacterium]|nr:hypothetical protein [Deltaproteobacteria bacterium]MBN2671139.1 hypothetical protein [Deltaproteobacteria bacterium]